ncbi:hypothetical protein PAPHI01_0705 [Pancytospora philotis]|nr:hypothetical protein PAPHI01_0705 [Pancytospora philotis]
MSSLKSKLFGYGFYGAPAEQLSTAELEEAMDAPYAEIVEHAAVERLMEDFSMRGLDSISALEEFSSAHVVRLSTVAWRDYIFGPGVNITSRVYFQLIDYLMRRAEFVNTSEVRRDLHIDPKTLFYLCKKLKALGIIEDQRDGQQTCIRVLPIAERLAEPREPGDELRIYEDGPAPSTEHLQLFCNTTLYAQVHALIESAPDGMDAKMLCVYTGLSPKVGYKLVQKLASLAGSDLCMVPEICYRSVVHKWYTRARYEKATRRRLEQIAGNAVADSRKSISVLEKETAMRIVAEKYGKFVLGKEIANEISTMTGWAYSFDRKTLLNTARAIGLHIRKAKSQGAVSYTLSVAPIDDAEASAPQDKTYESENRRLKAKFLWNTRFNRLDNGQALNMWRGYKSLAEFILAELDRRGCDTVSLTSLRDTMPLGLFYMTSGISKSCFRYIAAYSIWRSNRARFAGPEDGADTGRSIYYIDGNRELIKPAVFEIAQTVDALTVGEFLALAAPRHAEILRAYFFSPALKSALRRLHRKGFITAVEEAPDFMLGRGALATDSPRMQALIDAKPEKTHVNYNTRVHAYHRAQQIGLQGPREALREMLFKNYPAHIAEALYSPARQGRPEIARRTSKQPVVLPERLQTLYMDIKATIISGAYSGDAFYEQYGAADVETVLVYLMQRKVIGAKLVPRHASAVPLSKKFTQAFAYRPELIQNHTATVDPYCGLYFQRVHRIVEEGGSVDTGAILAKLRYVEEFELQRFFEAYADVFSLDKIDDFVLASLRDAQDPFLGFS